MKKIIVLCFFVCSFAVVSAFAQQNKVVVIPLRGSTSAAPETQYLVVGSESFQPGGNVNYFNTYGCGGAYVDAAGGHALVASVHLPHGAEVTNFEVFFNDVSDADMSVSLSRQHLTECGYSNLATVNSNGTSGYYSVADNTISDSIIDNTLNSYNIYAYSTSWSADLRIKGAVITYVK